VRAPRRRLPAAYRQNRARSEHYDAARDAAEQDPRQACPSVRSHHDHIGVLRSRCLDDLLVRDTVLKEAIGPDAEAAGLSDDAMEALLRYRLHPRWRSRYTTAGTDPPPGNAADSSTTCKMRSWARFVFAIATACRKAGREAREKPDGWRMIIAASS